MPSLAKAAGHAEAPLAIAEDRPSTALARAPRGGTALGPGWVERMPGACVDAERCEGGAEALLLLLLCLFSMRSLWILDLILRDVWDAQPGSASTTDTATTRVVGPSWSKDLWLSKIWKDSRASNGGFWFRAGTRRFC